MNTIYIIESIIGTYLEDIFWKMVWMFCPEMTLAQFPDFGFFIQNSLIGVILYNLYNIRIIMYKSEILYR